jgi:hypothetical protein
MTRTIDDSALDCIRFYMGDPEIIRLCYELLG